MDKTEKKINQILNLLNLTHEENMFFMETLSHSIVKEEDLQVLHEYMKKCNVKENVYVVACTKIQLRGLINYIFYLYHFYSMFALIKKCHKPTKIKGFRILLSLLYIFLEPLTSR